MENTDKSNDIMYARLKSKHNLSLSGYEDTERMSTEDFHFVTTLWTICDTMEEWDKLVIKFKKINGYNV